MNSKSASKIRTQTRVSNPDFFLFAWSTEPPIPDTNRTGSRSGSVWPQFRLPKHGQKLQSPNIFAARIAKIFEFGSERFDAIAFQYRWANVWRSFEVQRFGQREIKNFFFSGTVNEWLKMTLANGDVNFSFKSLYFLLFVGHSFYLCYCFTVQREKNIATTPDFLIIVRSPWRVILYLKNWKKIIIMRLIIDNYKHLK